LHTQSKNANNFGMRICSMLIFIDLMYYGQYQNSIHPYNTPPPKKKKQTNEQCPSTIQLDTSMMSNQSTTTIFTIMST
jgi:hypothetical protein